jgi:UDP-N-acetylmuramoylalanine--D-glutamate ligase
MIHSGKKAVVLGLGHSGEAAATLLIEEGAQVTVSESVDSPAIRAKGEDLQKRGANVLIGPEADIDPANYDVAILSPGIEPTAPLVRNVVAKGIPIIGELELAFQECTCPVVAITGTNGKTTTTELCTHILLQCGIRTMASGNIGLPFAKAVRQSQNLDVMVLEVSSFQLETVKSFHPKVAAWLNFSPNHLDRYASADEYRDAKLRILENLTAEDTLVINAQSVPLSTPAKIITFSAVKDDADFTLKNTTIHFHGNPVIDQETTHLHGIHNAENIMAALGIGIALHMDLGSMASAVANYTPPVHRCEFIREMDGVKWINDSKATNLDAMQMAIRSQTRPLILIAGGKDKGFGFEENSGLVHDKSRAVILIGEMRHRIAASWQQTQCYPVDTLEEAVSLASNLAQPGDAVLFSPGTSSFDMFRNYGERGNIFKSLVKKLKPKNNQ